MDGGLNVLSFKVSADIDADNEAIDCIALRNALCDAIDDICLLTGVGAEAIGVGETTMVGFICLIVLFAQNPTHAPRLIITMINRIVLPILRSGNPCLGFTGTSTGDVVGCSSIVSPYI